MKSKVVGFFFLMEEISLQQNARGWNMPKGMLRCISSEKSRMNSVAKGLKLDDF